MTPQGYSDFPAGWQHISAPEARIQAGDIFVSGCSPDWTIEPVNGAVGCRVANVPDIYRIYRRIPVAKQSDAHERDMAETFSKALGASFERSMAEQRNDATAKPSNNPKDAIGSNKLPLHLFPTTAVAIGSIGMLNGMLKYGRSNFRAIGVRSSIYYDAARRHLDAWFEGEECDPDDGVPHLAACLSCIAIIVDAEAAGKLNDDRMTPGGYRAAMDKLTPHVARLKKLHEGKNPRHYTK